MSGTRCETSEAVPGTVRAQGPAPQLDPGNSARVTDCGCSTREATYSTILWDNISKSEHETMTHHLCSEADAAWKVSHEVMYNHQLQYNQQLTTFLAEAETALSDMQDEVWATTRALAENDGVMFNACLRLTHSQLAPTASCRHFIPDADTPHHHLLP